MAEYGEWTRKRATLSDVTARKEYGVDWDFIVKGINSGKLEYREGAIHGNPYLRVLRRQLEAYITEELGDDYLHRWQEKTELRELSGKWLSYARGWISLRQEEQRSKVGIDRSADARAGLTFRLADKIGHTARVAATRVTEWLVLAELTAGWTASSCAPAVSL